MKIAFLHMQNFFEVQGAAEAYYLFNHLNEKNEIEVITSLNAQSQKELEHNCDTKIHDIPRISGKYVPFEMYFDFRALFKIIKNRPRTFDLIYAYKDILLTPLIIKILFRKKWVCDLQSLPVEQKKEFSKIQGKLSRKRLFYLTLRRYLYKLALKCCDLIVVVSSRAKDVLINKYHVSSDKIYVQPLGVDMDVFEPQGKIKKENTFDHAGTLNLIYITSIGLQRGIQTVFESINVLRAGGLPVRLKLVGSGPKEVMRQLRSLAETLGISEYVQFEGYVPHGEIPDLIERTDVCLSPLPDIDSYRVASPTKVFEYLAMGKVVIASDIPSNRSILTNCRNGLLFKPGDAKDLAEKIQRVYEDDKLRFKLEENARESVKQHNWNLMLEKLEKRLENLVVKS